MISPSIHEFVKSQETAFEADEIQVAQNWFWNFRRHVQMIFHLVNGVFYTGANDFLRVVKNIMEPILNLAFWTEDLEVKDVVFYVEGEPDRVLSFLLKKYHDEVYVREHNLDTLFDEIAEDDITYGGVLVQKTDTARPEVLPLMKIAFCDQTDILGGPVAFKHYFSPDKLREMSKYGWGEKKNGATISLDDLAVLASAEKDPAGTLNKKTNRVPGKTVEVYIVRGNLPEHYLLDNDNLDDWYNQVQIIAYYKNPEGTEQKVWLYRKKELDSNLKFFTSKRVEGRALGRGEGEATIHPQIWTNCLEIWKHQMLEAASKVPLWTDDEGYTAKNKIQEMENLEITVLREGRRIGQVPTAATANIQLFSQSINDWYNHAQLVGSAFDPLIGKEPPSGTTFRGQERSVAQGRGLHERRRGQRAKFLEEIYRDWIIPDMVKRILKGKEFVATLSGEELTWVAEQLADNEAEKRIREAILDGKTVIDSDREIITQLLKDEFIKSGNRKLLKILKGEFRGVEVRMGINIANKQKDLVNLSDKLLSTFQFIFANPQAFQQAMQIPALAKTFNDLLEFSGMQQADFASLMNMPTQSAVAQPLAQPMEQPQLVVGQ